jgi:hypothetical protein
MVLSFYWPDDMISSPLFSIDRNELHTITQRHLLEALQGRLGATLVTAVTITLTPNSNNINTNTESTTSLTMPNGNEVAEPSAKEEDQTEASSAAEDQAWVEVLTGTVTLKEDSGIPPATVKQLVQEAFSNDGLEMYEFRFKISTDLTLRLIQSVEVGTTDGDDGLEDEEQEGMDDMFIIVIASCAGAVAAVCIFGYCLFLHYAAKVEKNAQAHVQAAIESSKSSVYRSSVASSSKHSRVSRISIQNLPMVKDTAKALGDSPPHHNDDAYSDEENPMSLISMSAFGDDENPRLVLHPYDLGMGNGHGGQSHHSHQDDAASVYSYSNQAEDHSLVTNDETFLGSMIAAKNGLYDDESTVGGWSLNGTGAGAKPKFSVIDTLAKHGGDNIRSGEDDSVVEHEYNGYHNHASQQAKSSFVGIERTSKRYEQGKLDNHGFDVETTLMMDTNHDSNGLYSARTISPTNLTLASEELDDYGSVLDTTAVPIRERMESIWAREDGYEQNKEKDPQVDGKSSRSSANGSQRVKVFTDDGSGRHSASDGGIRNTSFESDGSATASLLQQQTPAPAVDSAQSSSSPLMTVSIVRTNSRLVEESSGKDDDDAMGLQLPNQLRPVDVHNDNVSQSSTLSTRSGRSARSSARNNSFGAASLKAQAKALLQKGSKSMNSESPSGQDDASVKSSDSAMYRSLLEQDDKNDARLFGTASSQASSKSRSSSASPPEQPTQQLSNLIQSFDEVWSKEEETGLEQPTPVETAVPRMDIDSDEDEVYLEGNDDDDNDDDKQTDNDSVKSGASRVVQQLSSMLKMPILSISTTASIKSKVEDVGDNGPSPTKVTDVPNEGYSLETKRSFEIQDSSDDESEHGANKDDAEEAAQMAINMERLRRMSLGGYAETMASF